jgi:hypothetical protein
MDSSTIKSYFVKFLLHIHLTKPSQKRALFLQDGHNSIPKGIGTAHTGSMRADSVLFRWMLTLTAPRVKAAIAYYSRTLGLDDTVFTQSSEEGGQLNCENDARRPLIFHEIGTLLRSFVLETSLSLSCR